MDGEDLWWHLVDEEAQAKMLWQSIPNAPQTEFFLERTKGDWYASTYDIPLESIIAEAAENFCDSFERYVLPKLSQRIET